MSEPTQPPPHVHPEATLLPWYAAGTLSEPERQELSRHLDLCASCRAELEEIMRLSTAVKRAYAEAPEPHAAVWQRVQSRIGASPAHTRVPAHSEVWAMSWWARPWVPAFATALIVAQVVGMGWLLSERASKGSSPSGTETGPVVSRSIPPATARVKVSFLERATEQEIRALLQEIHGRIADGPLPGDFYLIEVPMTGATGVDQAIHKLQGTINVVRSAELAPP
ncbi:MAG: zf-HC2 domain-containing protein [Nitrospirae bacterium]|nr:zf-HC2 domain-containing protein [Nitrospirota bacterium]